MKRFITFLAILMAAVLSFAQIPQTMSYQAVVRDGDNALVISKPVSIELSILRGSDEGTVVYAEKHDAATNANGLVSLELGNGEQISETAFSQIDWSAGPYFVKTVAEIDGKTVTGVTPMLTVPYAKFAEKAGNIPDLTDYAKKSDIPEGANLDGYVKSEVLNDYAKTADVEQTYAKKDELPTEVDLSDYAKKSDLDGFATTAKMNDTLNVYAKSTDVSGNYVTKEEFENYVLSGGQADAIDLSVYAKSADVNAALAELEGKIPAEQDLTNYATKEELNALNIPSVEGLASETYVNEQVAAIQIPSVPTKVSDLENDANYITLNDVPATDLTDYAKSADVSATYVTKEEFEDYVLSGGQADAIDLSVYAKSADVNAALAELEGKIPAAQDLSGYATKEELNALNIPSVEGLASETYVNEQVAAIQIPTVPTKVSDFENDANYITLSDVPATDLTGYATTEKLKDTLAVYAKSEALNDYATTAKMNDTLDAYVLKSEMGSTTLDGYYSKAEVDALLAEMNERFAALSDWVEASKNPKLSKPTLSKEVETDITVYAKITSAGFGDILERGFVCSRTPNPTVADNEKKYVATGTTVDENYYGSFDYLASGYTYYIRAYATSSTGTGYSEPYILTTTLMAPVINSGGYRNVTAESFEMHSSVKFEAQITQWGFCYSSTSETPTISGDKVTVDVAGTDFEATITGLTPGKTYYVRPFATNSMGTIYGSTYTVTTPAVPPTVEGLSTTEVAGKSFKVTAEIAFNGGATVMAKGFCYSMSENPTIEDSKVTGEQAEDDSFVAEVTELSPVTTYYVRAYATNSAGTSYSEQITVTTTAVLATVVDVTSSDITGDSFKVSSSITDNGGAEVTEKGFCYSTTENPTIESSKKVVEGDEFEITIDELAPVTTYYVRAYVTNSIGTAYSDQISVKTSAILAMVSEVTSSEITGVSFKVSSAITDNGGAEVTEKGFCYSTTENPTVEYSKLAVDGVDFEMTIAELENGTTYYVRAYAVNSVGTAYSDQISVRTLALATVADVTSSEITGVSFKISSSIIANGGAEVTEKGFCYSTTENPTIEDNKKVVDGDGFVETISSLSPVTAYYVRAYATNSVGTAYSEQVLVKTLAVLATVADVTSASITGTSFNVSSKITDDGGEEASEKGFCYSVTENPTVANSKKVVDGDEFEVMIDELANGTNYYVRAYATNSAGTAYSGQISVLTLAPAMVADVTSSDITGVSFKVSSAITANGGAEVTEKGFCYSTTENPTVESSKNVVEGDAFETTIAELVNATTYYVRAYAVNSVGTAYSDQVSVKTLAVLATVADVTSSEISGTSLKVSSKIIANGGAEITEKGFCYSTIENPTVEDSKQVVDGDDFAYTISDLSYATTYYVRAYAVNSVGIVYSEQISVKTKNAPYINGAFSVSATKQIYFSSGNLQYQASTSTWRFAENQWDYVGNATNGTVYENGVKCSNAKVSETYEGWIDLFSWGTSGYNGQYPYMTPTYTNNNDISGTNYDWGVYNAISNGGNQAGSWYTLTRTEWVYVLNTRTDAADKKGSAKVNNVFGVVLLPDNWTLPSGMTFTSGYSRAAQNIYSAEEWAKMEANGAVFFPEGGKRSGTTVSYAGAGYGYYWSGTAYSNTVYNRAYSMGFYNSLGVYDDGERGTGMAVRLVKNAN